MHVLLAYNASAWISPELFLSNSSRKWLLSFDSFYPQLVREGSGFAVLQLIVSLVLHSYHCCRRSFRNWTTFYFASLWIYGIFLLSALFQARHVWSHDPFLHQGPVGSKLRLNNNAIDTVNKIISKKGLVRIYLAEWLLTKHFYKARVTGQEFGAIRGLIVSSCMTG